MKQRIVFSAILCLLFMLSLFSPPDLIAQENEQEEKEKKKQITEEIVVEAERPKDVPLRDVCLGWCQK